MTRKSKREIERALEDLDEGDDGDDYAIVFEEPETGDWYPTAAMDTIPIDPDTVDVGVLIVVRDTVVETGWSPEA